MKTTRIHLPGTRIFYAGWLVLALAGSSRAETSGGGRDGTIALIEENDSLYQSWGPHQDRHYTQGAKFIYMGGGQPAPPSLPRLGLENPTISYGGFFGQNIYTPQNNLATNLITSDRPYAGWLYGGAAMQRRGKQWGAPAMENLELDLGIIGPEAQGGRSQNDVHRLLGFHTFDGWNNQLRTEVAFLFKYGRAWRFSFSDKTRKYFDVIPMAGANLGTVMVSGTVGTTARLGFNLPDDFGAQTVDSTLLISSGRSPSPVGFYVFGRAEGRAVGRNVFLDGNLVAQSFSIEKKPLVADVAFGASLNLLRHIEVSYTMTTRTLEFVGQNGQDRFGSILLQGKWGF